MEGEPHLCSAFKVKPGKAGMMEAAKAWPTAVRTGEKRHVSWNFTRVAAVLGSVTLQAICGCIGAGVFAGSAAVSGCWMSTVHKLVWGHRCPCKMVLPWKSTTT